MPLSRTCSTIDPRGLQRLDFFRENRWIAIKRGHQMLAIQHQFAFFLEHGPGFLFRVGTGMNAPQLHTSGYEFSDASLATGIAMLAGMAIRRLEQK